MTVELDLVHQDSRRPLTLTFEMEVDLARLLKTISCLKLLNAILVIIDLRDVQVCESSPSSSSS